MSHLPIQLQDISLVFSHKSCFENFTTTILPNSRIGIIGRNGSGKSSLLKMLAGIQTPTSGKIIFPSEMNIGYVPQLVENTATDSGGERFNDALTKALSQYPDILLLDEPTNHLDAHNRRALFRLLENYSGTLIAISHDTTLLRECVDSLWHLENGQWHIFHGNYDDYLRETEHQRKHLEKSLSQLQREKKSMHDALMQEQQRAAKSRRKGQKSIDQRKWPTVVSKAKVDRAANTTGQKKARLAEKKQQLEENLSHLYLPEIIQPTFHLPTQNKGHRMLVSIRDGSIGYPSQPLLLENLHFSLLTGERVAIIGKNGSGKSTLLKAMLNNPNILRSGHWEIISADNIGYLDQHYAMLNPAKTVLETLQQQVPSWESREIRLHLHDFLFRHPAELNACVSTLSGGEKARLTLATIAAHPPQLLILDEITNNLDLETKTHIIQILRDYPGALLVVSHDEEFLQEIEIDEKFSVDNT